MTANNIQEEVVIAGAGVAGMMTALALAAHNISSTIYEKSVNLQEVGAGLQLAPNATKLLNRLNLLTPLEPYLSEPDAIDLCNAQDGKTLLSLPVKEIANNRWDAKYYTIHRADLQKVLKKEIDNNPHITFKSGHNINTIAGNNDNGYKIDFLVRDTSDHVTNKKITISAKKLVICDGVWSNCRANICHEKSQFSGYIAWRSTLPKEDLPKSFFENAALNKISAYMSKDSHFIIYPLRKGSLYNFVVVTKGKNVGTTWSQQGDKSALIQLLKAQNSFLRDIVEKAPSWTYWPLFQMPFPRFLGSNGEIFLGDASHAVTPFAAQGAAQAIEDASTLAEVFSREEINSTSSLKEQLINFNTTRTKRLKAVANRGDFNRFVYHLSGPLGCARNLVMRFSPQSHFISSLDSLYGYDAIADLDQK